MEVLHGFPTSRSRSAVRRLEAKALGLAARLRLRKVLESSARAGCQQRCLELHDLARGPADREPEPPRAA